MKLLTIVIVLLSILTVSLSLKNNSSQNNKSTKEINSPSIKTNESKISLKTKLQNEGHLFKIKKLDKPSNLQTEITKTRKTSSNIYASADQTIFRIQIYEGHTKICEGNFDINTVNPQSPDFATYNRGIYISDYSSFNEADKDTMDVMVKEGNKLFIPYRTLSEFSYTDPWLSNQYLATTLRTPAQKIISIYIYFPYCLLCKKIDNKIGLRVKDNLNICRIEKQAFIAIVKNDLYKAANTYITTDEMLNKINANLTTLQRIDAINKEIATLEVNIQNQVKKLQVSNDKLQELERQIADEKFNNNEIKTQLQTQNENKAIFINTVEKLKKETEPIKNQKDDLNAILQNQQKMYKSIEEKLIREAPHETELIKTASDDLFIAKDMAKAKGELDQILA